MELPIEIWKKRAELLRKARDGKLSFGEFNLLDMHKETRSLLAKSKPTLSPEGIVTLNAIEMYIERNRD